MQVRVAHEEFKIVTPPKDLMASLAVSLLALTEKTTLISASNLGKLR
jgi:hypothetical protein